MKKIYSIIAGLFLVTCVLAQAPNKMSYQAIIRNTSNALVGNSAVGMRISILQTSASGTAVYVETQTPTTNANGLASIEIGGGTVVSGNFTTIDWANGPYFLKTETDPAGGTNYTITGTSQFLSVPYALFSGNGIVGVSALGDTLYLGNGNHIIIPGISSSNSGGVGGQTGITQHSCGADSVHNPNLIYGSMTDQDGNTYKTIVIGTQEWMAENLKASHYRNGDLIPVESGLNWWNLTTGALTWYYSDSTSNHCPYGKLYNGYATVDVRNLCPSGWHVPSDSEWNILVMQIDPAADTTIQGQGQQSAIAGGKMKSTGMQYWTLPNSTSDNSSGFSGLPGGYRVPVGDYFEIGEEGIWWSSAEGVLIGPNLLWSRSLDYSSYINKQAYSKNLGFSVRCIRD